MFKVTYTDDTTFEGGIDLADTKWNDIDKPIKMLEYQLGEIHFILENCESYNHLVEWVQSLNNENAERATKIIVLAKLAGKILKINIDFNKGQVTKEFVNEGKEYNSKPTTGWKIGVALLNTCPPKFKLFKKNNKVK